MHFMSEKGSTFSKAILIMGVIGGLSLYGVYLCQKIINEARANEIVNGVWKRAEQEKAKIDSKDAKDDEDALYEQTERKNYDFTATPDSISTLIKIETGKKMITPGVCQGLKTKLRENQWRDVFKKVLLIDRMGDEKTDILIYDCPNGLIPSLRFYIEYPEIQKLESEETEEAVETKPEPAPLPVVVPPPVSTPSPTPTPRVTPTPKITPSYTRPSCPSGTSASGLGGSATAGCRCNRSGEIWNGKSCEMKACPTGSSRTAFGDRTNVSGCRCNNDTPIWLGNRCVACNKDEDCSSGNRCLDHQCVVVQDEPKDCRWGVCQTCDEMGVHRNILDELPCETAGLEGVCNGNGTCYPTAGRKCSSVRGCPRGEFCNFGGNLNSTKKQQGRFGQTPNVCQKVTPLEFTYKNVRYYYNSEKDLKSWCRAANNKANCLWGYLAKSGAQSWCASLGKRLLTQAEMAEVWDVLKKELPQTYKGYAYWVQEGVWLENIQGGRSFGKKHPDGYGGRGGVVCR